jgi:hypothetical protein
LKRRPAGDGPPVDGIGRPDIGPSEPFAIRWKRRAVTIPTMLGATAAAIVLLPLLAAGAVAYDAAHLKLRLPTLRSLLFVVQYLLNDSLEILVAPLYWALAGFGTRLDSPASLRRHERLQQWSIDVLSRRAERLLGVNIEIDADSAALERGPLIVCCRHVNLLDASLPSLLLRLRHVLPPRPGGLNALLDALPQADVVFIAHTGLDDYPRFADVARDVPLRHPVSVAAWRVAQSDIPTAAVERTRWLDTQWRPVDDWVHANAER